MTLGLLASRTLFKEHLQLTQDISSNICTDYESKDEIGHVEIARFRAGSCKIVNVGL
jgi:hypothetical protein